MVNEILKASGVPFRETQWVGRPPETTYAIYMDDVNVDGADDVNLISQHDITIELYESKADPKIEKALENQFNVRGIKWTKQSRYWLTESQRYQVIYEFSYIEKI